MDGFFCHHTKPGTAPGTLAGRAPAPDKALDFTLVEYTPADAKVVHGVEVDECRFHLGTPGQTCIAVTGRPNSDTLRDLGMAFNLHPLALEDVVVWLGIEKSDWTGNVSTWVAGSAHSDLRWLTCWGWSASQLGFLERTQLRGQQRSHQHRTFAASTAL